jgi:hypothetical protein
MATVPTAPAVQKAGGVKTKVPPTCAGPGLLSSDAAIAYSPETEHVVNCAAAGRAKPKADKMKSTVVRLRG